MAEEQPSSQAPSRDEPDGYYISLDYTSSAALADGPSLAWGAPVVDQGEDTGFDEQVYCWGGSSEGEAGVESDGGEEVGYPDDPDEVSEHDALSGPDTLSDHDELSEHDAVSDTHELSDPNALSDPNGSSPSKNSSPSEERSNINEQSDADSAFEVAYGYLRSLPVSASSNDPGTAGVGLVESAIASSMAERSQRSPAPVPEHASAEHLRSEEEIGEVASEILQRRLARRLKREQNLSVSDSREDAGKVEVEDRESAITSRMVECPQSSPAPASEEQQQSEETTEHAGHEVQQQNEEAAERAASEVQQRRIARRLKMEGDLLGAISTMDSEVSKRIAAMLPSSKATVSDTPTSDALCMSSITKELENIGGKQRDGLILLRPARPPKASWTARFASAPLFEDCYPYAKRIKFGLESGQWSIEKPDYIKLAIQFYKKYGVTGCPFGRSSRSGRVIGGIWEHAQMVDLGQPTLQRLKLSSRQQWPKPAQQSVEPPPWQSFLESMRRPVQQSVKDTIRQVAHQPDTQSEQQSIQQAVQQLARLTVKDTITDTVGQPVQQPVHVPPYEGAKDRTQQSIEGPVKTPDRSSNKTVSAKQLEDPEQQSTEEPIKKPKIKLLFGRKPEQESSSARPTEQHSPKPPSSKSPVQRRVERFKQLNKDSGEKAISPSSKAASSQPISRNGLAVSDITVVCDFQPMTPDISSL